MMELKVGNIIDVVECDDNEIDCSKCILVNTPDCHHAGCSLLSKNLILKLREGPKQGDTVWGRSSTNNDWHKGEFVSNFGDAFVMLGDSGFIGRNYMTTTNPYTLKYDLTAQEAKHLIIEGKTVQGSQQRRKAGYKWFDGNGIVQVNLETGSVLLARDIASTDMYAVVED